MAWNLWHYGVMSRVADHGVPPKPTWRREPLYPALLAGVLWLRADPAAADIGCIFAARKECRPLIRALKQLNVLLLLALAGAAFLASREILGRGVLAWLAYGLVAANGVFWSLLDDFRTETATALALLLASLFLHRIALGSRRAADVLGAGASFGALMLVKAIFFYAGAALVPLAIWIGLRPGERERALRLAAALALAYGIAGVWMARNAAHGGPFRIAEDRAVLAIRAEYDTMSWREWSAAWLYYARPFPPARWALERGFAPEDWARLERKNRAGFYLRAKRDVGAAAERLGFPERPKPAALEAAAREVILANLPMHVAVTGSARGAGLLPLRALLRVLAGPEGARAERAAAGARAARPLRAAPRARPAGAPRLLRARGRLLRAPRDRDAPHPALLVAADPGGDAGAARVARDLARLQVPAAAEPEVAGGDVRSQKVGGDGVHAGARAGPDISAPQQRAGAPPLPLPTQLTSVP